MDVNFAAGTLTGTASNFANIENTEIIGNDEDPIVDGDVSGSLAFNGTQAASTEAVFELLFSGELSGPDGSFLDYDEAGGAADIYGSNADVMHVVGGEYVQFDGEDGYIAVSSIASKQ